MQDDLHLKLLERAKADLNATHVDMDNGNICFHAQQSIKNSIKAALIFENIEPLYTNDLYKIVKLLPSYWKITPTLCDYDRISTWYLTGKDPDQPIQDDKDSSYGQECSEKIYNLVETRINCNVRNVKRK